MWHDVMQALWCRVCGRGDIAQPAYRDLRRARHESETTDTGKHIHSPRVPNHLAPDKRHTMCRELFGLYQNTEKP